TRREWKPRNQRQNQERRKRRSPGERQHENRRDEECRPEQPRWSDPQERDRDQKDRGTGRAKHVLGEPEDLQRRIFPDLEHRCRSGTLLPLNHSWVKNVRTSRLRRLSSRSETRFSVGGVDGSRKGRAWTVR